jgi:3',5'-cyclic AMP phosphodiesterase CpdA
VRSVLARVLLPLFAFTCVAAAQTTIAQISDLHLGLGRAPKAADNLRQVVDMINQRHPDAVVVTGDIGERPENWDQAKQILSHLQSKVYYVPGNHDVHTNDVERYRAAFGDDYYKIRVKNVVIYGLDSELLGNFDTFDNRDMAATQPTGLARSEGDRMLDWMSRQGGGQMQPGDRDRDNDKKKHKKDKHKDHDRDAADRDRGQGNGDSDDRGTVVIGMQHVPGFRDDRVIPDSKPYWELQDPYRSRELDALKRLGIRHMLVGHWHHSDIFERGGIVWHVAPATSWLTFGGSLGFAMHTITPDGDVKTDFVYLPSSADE